MGNKEIEYINAIREVEEKWNGTEEELKMEMKELEKRMNHIGTIDSDLAGKFSNSVKEGVERKKLELNALQEFCKTK